MDADTMNYFRGLTRSYYDIQKQRIEADHRLRSVEQPEYVAFCQEHVIGRLRGAEHDIQEEIKRILPDFPLFTDYLSQIRGIGPILSASLMAETYDPRSNRMFARFRTPSALWAFAGVSVGYLVAECENEHKVVVPSLNVPKKCRVLAKGKKGTKECGSEVFKVLERHPGEAPRRKAGCRCGWSTFLKVTAWKIGDSFSKQGGVYRVLKEQFQLSYGKVNCPEDQLFDPLLFNPSATALPPWVLHSKQQARRKATKIFLAGCWQVSCEKEGVKTRKPWIIEHGGHDTFIPAMIDTEDGPKGWGGAPIPRWILKAYEEKFG